MHTTGWSKNLEVTADGQGVVSHAGLALLRQLADKTGLTGGLSRALATPRLLIHDRGRVTADLACAVADGSEVISDFRVLTDQKELFGLVASVPTVWRTLDEIAAGGPRALARITRAVNAARRQAWAGIEARHGALPGVRIADKVLQGVTCIRLDATVTPAHSDKELAEPNYKGFGHHPLLGYCDNTGEPLAGMMRRGSAGSNTAADHLQVLGDTIAALPPKHRRRLIRRRIKDKLISRPGQYTFYLCWAPEDRPATMTYFITIAGRRWPVEETFKTGKNVLGWDQAQVRTWDGINRHTALTALAQLRQIAIRNAVTGAITLPAAPGTGDPGHGSGTAGDEHVSDADLRIPLGDAPLPARGGQPCPPRIAAIRLSVAETARLTALARQAAAGLLTRARLASALRWSLRRRRHQATARWHHHSARLLEAAT